VYITGAGSIVFSGDQAGNSNYAAAPQVSSLGWTISQASNVITFPAIPNQTISTNPIHLMATANSGLTVGYKVFSGSALLTSSNELSVSGIGTITIEANQIGDSNWSAAIPLRQSFEVSKGSQTITFDTLNGVVYSNGLTTNLGASASSGLGVRYSSSSTNISLLSNRLTVLGVGTATIVAAQAGNSNYLAAISVTNRLVIGKGAGIVAISGTNASYSGTGNRVVVTTTPTGLSKRVTYNGVTNLPVNAGSYSVVATITNAIYEGSGTATLTISKADNTISAFSSITNRVYASNAIMALPAPLPTATSKLPVTFSVKSGPGVMSGTNAIKITGAGAVVLAANQPGNTNYQSALEVTTSFQILHATQSVASFTAIAAQTNGTAPFAVTIPKASSGLPVILSVLSGPATVTNSIVTLTGAGTVVLAANQPGDTNYLAAPQVTTSFSVAKGKQTITFAALSTMNEGSTSLPLGATASSGLPVSYSSSSTNITISSNMVTILGGGAATITASQGGDANWNAAANVVRTLIVMGSSSATNDTTNQIAGVGLVSTIPSIPVRPKVFPLIRPSNKGSVFAWGNNAYNQTNIPAGLTNVVQLSSWGGHSLALKAGGAVVAWGWNAYGQTNVPTSVTNAAQVAAGVSFSAALRTNGSIIAWGDNSLGQTNIPAGLTNAVQIAAGSDHALALRSDGTVTGWGWNTYGQTTIPVDATNVVQLDAGYFHSVALRANGTVVAWGDDTYGETDVPVGLTHVVSIATGLNHTVALKDDGTVVVWGWNNAGQTNVPPGLSGVAQIASGGNTVFAVTTNGTLVTWGDNTYGQRKPPAGLTNVTQFVLGLYHGLGLKK
jgi:hypothetical protein